VATERGANQHDPKAASAPSDDPRPSDQEIKWKATSWDAALARLPASPHPYEMPDQAEIPRTGAPEGARPSAPTTRSESDRAKARGCGVTILGAIVLIVGLGVIRAGPLLSTWTDADHDPPPNPAWAIPGVLVVLLGIWMMVWAHRSAASPHSGYCRPYSGYCRWCREGYHAQCTSPTCECQRYGHEPPPPPNALHKRSFF
jgi:hypothetical protein